MSRVLSSVLVIVLMAVGALAALTNYSDAQEPTECPANTVLSADGTTCLSDAVNDNVVTTSSCIQGVLSDDGKSCIVPRTDAAPAPAPATDVAVPVPTFTG